MPAALFALVLAYGLVRIPQVDGTTAAAARIKVALVQTNLGARDKGADPGFFIGIHQALSRMALAAHPDVDLLVWPESAYNRWLPRDQRNMREAVTRGLDRPMIWGADLPAPPDGRRRHLQHRSRHLGLRRCPGSYDKIELLLFGERIPLANTFPEIRRWFPRSSTFTPARAWSLSGSGR